MPPMRWKALEEGQRLNLTSASVVALGRLDTSVPRRLVFLLLKVSFRDSRCSKGLWNRKSVRISDAPAACIRSIKYFLRQISAHTFGDEAFSHPPTTIENSINKFYGLGKCKKTPCTYVYNPVYNLYHIYMAPELHSRMIVYFSFGTAILLYCYFIYIIAWL